MRFDGGANAVRDLAVLLLGDALALFGYVYNGSPYTAAMARVDIRREL